MAADSTSEEEVRRLERHYSVNPDGLVFARLADAYRRTGRLEEALDLLRDGLDRHPDYTTGHLIAGRTLRAADRPADAAESFRRVLELDAQNLVALRALAEIATERGDLDEARRWADRLQRADPFASFSLAEARHEAARKRPEEESRTGPAPGDAAEEASPAAEVDVARDGPPPEAGGAPLPGEEELADEIAAMADDQWWSSAPEGDGAEEDGAEVATETMAHLYAQQGLHEEAAHVYRRLLERRPEDEELQSRLEEMERRAGPGGADDGDAAPAAEDPGPGEPAPEPEGGAEATGATDGEAAVTAREHFRALLRGEATRPGDGPGTGAAEGSESGAAEGEETGAAAGRSR